MKWNKYLILNKKTIKYIKRTRMTAIYLYHKNIAIYLQRSVLERTALIPVRQKHAVFMQLLLLLSVVVHVSGCCLAPFPRKPLCCNAIKKFLRQR